MTFHSDFETPLVVSSLPLNASLEIITKILQSLKTIGVSIMILIPKVDLVKLWLWGGQVSDYRLLCVPVIYDPEQAYVLGQLWGIFKPKK